jgi:hypothetical protein
MGLTTLPCKKKIVEKPQRNSAGFCGGGQGLGWAVEPRKEEESGRGVTLTTHLHLVPRMKMREAVIPLPHMSSWGGHFTILYSFIVDAESSPIP